MTIQKTTVDAYVDQDTPGTNFRGKTRMKIRGGSSHQKYIYLHFTRPFPLTAILLSATLRVYLSGAWTGSTSITCQRISQKWAESTIKWNNRPNVNATHAAADSVSGGVEGDVVEFDVAAILQDVSDGANYFGYRLSINTDAVRFIHSGESANVDVRPELELEWSDQPEPPDRLSPDGDNFAVADAFPHVSWRYNDKIAGHKQQTASQVQTSTDIVGFDEDTGFAAPDYDSGQVTNDQNDFTIDATGGYTGLVEDEVTYWAVKVWDNAGLDSQWSQPAEMTYKPLGTLTIDEPDATVPETTPPVTWTLSGRTQERYQITVFQVPDTGKLIKVYQVADTGTENSITIPAGVIKIGPTYRVSYEIWDTFDRSNDVHIGDADHPETTDFTYVLDATPDPVDTFAAVAIAGSPGVDLGWTRSVQPDYFALLVDDEIVLDRIDPDNHLVAPNTYEMTYWGATPRQTHTYEVQAVVQASPGTPFKHSASSAVVSIRTNPVGIWLVDQDGDGKSVQIVGQETFDASIGESATTFDPVGGRSPVRIVDAMRGYEGTVSGTILGLSDRNDFLTLKGRQTELQLIVGAVTIPIRLEEVSLVPTASPGDLEQALSFTFFQSGPPWPTRNVT